MKSRLAVEDFRAIVRGLQAAFPRDNFIPNEYTFNLWYTALQDIPYPSLNRASTSYIMSNRFPPTIADIRQLAYDLSAQPDELPSVSWNQLLRALRMSYAPNSEEVWEQLPEITKKIVGGYATFRAWGNTELSALESVQRPMFVKRFEEYSQRERRAAAIPQALRKPKPALPAPPEKPAIEVKQSAGESVKAPGEMMKALRERLGEKHT